MSTENKSRRGRVIFFLILGMVPILVVGAVAWRVTDRIQDQVAERLAGSALGLAEQVERELELGYHDLKLASTDPRLTDRSSWYRSWETNTLVETLNGWVSEHTECLLTVLVDTKGELIAVNNLDAAGDSIPSDLLYLINHATADWFEEIEHLLFMANMDETRQSTETTPVLIKRRISDRDVIHCYPNTEGDVITFTAPVIEDGQVIAYLIHRFDFNLVGNLFPMAREKLQDDLPGLRITLLDGENLILADAGDPVTSDTSEIQGSEAGEITPAASTLYLHQGGRRAMATASEGGGDFTWDFSSVGTEVQAAGLAPLSGSDLLPTLDWTICLQVSRDELMQRSGLGRVRSQLKWTLAALIPILAGLLMVLWRELDRKPRPHRESLLATQRQEHLLGQLDLEERVERRPAPGRLSRLRRRPRVEPDPDDPSTVEVRRQLEELSREMINLGLVEQELAEMQQQIVAIKGETEMLRRDRALALKELEQLRDENLEIWQTIATREPPPNRKSIRTHTIGDAAVHELAHDLAASTGEPVVITQVGQPGEVVVEPIRLPGTDGVPQAEPAAMKVRHAVAAATVADQVDHLVESENQIPIVEEPAEEPRVMAARASQSTTLMDFSKDGDMAARRISNPVG